MRTLGFVSAAFLSAAALMGVGCRGAEVLGCVTNTECPGGHACRDTRCLKLCTVQAECSAGTYCDGTFCVDGGTGVPIIEAVRGNSQEDCEVFGVTVPCLGSRIVVVGKNLSEATYALEPNGGGSPIALNRVASTGNSVDLVPVGSVTGGLYTLRVTNGAGSAAQEVELLPGAPGPSGPSGPTGPMGPPGVGSGSAGELFLYENSNTPTTTNIQADRIVVVLNKQFGSVQTVAIDQDHMVRLCGDVDGCQITIGISGYVFGGTYINAIESTWFGPPCRFSMEDTNPPSGLSYRWSLSQSCWAPYVMNFDGYEYVVRQYYSEAAGTDGYWKAGANENERDKRIVAAYLRACLLTEAAPDTTVQDEVPTFVDEDSVGFHFSTADESWWYHADSDRGSLNATQWVAPAKCVLVIED